MQDTCHQADVNEFENYHAGIWRRLCTSSKTRLTASRAGRFASGQGSRSGRGARHSVSTTYSEHAGRAFEVQALDYLLKPSDRDRFLQSAARVHAALISLMARGMSNFRRLIRALLRVPRDREQRSTGT